MQRRTKDAEADRAGPGEPSVARVVPRSGLETPGARAFLDLLRVREALLADFAEVYREHDLSEASYNVLRILRGALPAGLPHQEVRRRMVTRLPDITRLVDRLEQQGLVRRERQDDDRRVVLVRITTAGLRLLAALDRPVLEIHARRFAALDDAEVATLGRLLHKLLDAGETRPS
jgi:DNA-binding MarR family transcriptional regulator